MQADAVSEVVTCIEYGSPIWFSLMFRRYRGRELGFFKQEGIEIEFIHNTKEGPELMREGKLDFIAGPAFAGTRAFHAWKGIKLLCALSQYSYWFMAVRSTLDVKRGDLRAIKGHRISAAPAWPEMSLRYRRRHRSRTRQR